MVQKKGKTLYERAATSTHDLDKPENKAGKVKVPRCRDFAMLKISVRSKLDWAKYRRC